MHSYIQLTRCDPAFHSYNEALEKNLRAKQIRIPSLASREIEVLEKREVDGHTDLRIFYFDVRKVLAAKNPLSLKLSAFAA